MLLKQLQLYPDHVEIFRSSGAQGAATLVVLDNSVSAYDRQAYPKATFSAFVSSDHPDLTAPLLDRVPRDVGIVFKLASEADRAPVAARFAVERRRAFLSFTSERVGEAQADVDLTVEPGDAAFRLFKTQGHERAWLERMLANGKAFACVLPGVGEPSSVCFAFENYGSIWEVGGVVTPPAHRRKGLAARVVRTALAELSRRRLTPRYQVEESNIASIALAHAIGLRPFVTATHYAHAC